MGHGISTLQNINMKVIHPLPNNQDLACYYVTKHSWKGKYKRIFSIGTQGITTYNPNNLEVTNRWSYADILEIKYLPNQPDFFTLFFVKENSRKDGMKFSSEHRSRIIIDLLKQKYNNALGSSAEYLVKVDAFKHSWSETRLPVTLVVTNHSLDQMSPVGGGDGIAVASQSRVLSSYPFNTIETIQTVTDVQNGFVVVSKPFGRMHLFTSQRRDVLVQKIVENSSKYCGIPLELSTQPLSFSDYQENKFGAYGEDRHITSLSEFSVLKFSTRATAYATTPGTPTDLSPHATVRRLLCLTESCLVERDPATYNIVTVKPLQDIFAVIRDVNDSQAFSLEFTNMKVYKYSVPQRDALLATLLDGVRSSGNRDVHVKMKHSDFGKRWAPPCEPVEEEVESFHLKFLYQAPKDRKYEEVIDRFNVNIPYSGLNHSVTADGIFAENKEKLILSALQSLLAREGDQSELSVSAPDLEAQFHTMRRLVASRVGFAALTAMPSFRDTVGLKVVKALNRENEAISHASVDMLCGLMHPMHAHDDPSDLRQEQLNKSCLLSNHKFLDALLDMWIRHVTLGTGALVVSAMLDFLTFALCVPYSETTESKHFDALLTLVAQRGRPLFQHFQHPSLSIIKGAGLIMRALIEEGEADVSGRLQHLALCEAALPRHLLSALYSGGDRTDTMHRQLSRHLIGLWVTDNEAAHSLLSRMLPLGLLQFLESEEEVPPDAVEQDVELRDNLKLAQDHASRNQRNPHLVKIERHMKTLEKNIEHALQHWSTSLGLDQRPPGYKTSTGTAPPAGGTQPINHKERPIVLRKRRERVKSSANWKLFYYKFSQNHSLPRSLTYFLRESLGIHFSGPRILQYISDDTLLPSF
uniref:DnaJ homolog subfamily C member 13 n=1 Tax=Cacopsylla melanoneura TaxID=428564 RepID=A0A8D8R647_9HEMI